MISAIGSIASAIRKSPSQTASLPSLALSSSKPNVAAPGNTFSIDSAGIAASNTPVLAEWTKEAKADDHILLTGQGLASGSTQFSLYKQGQPLLTPTVATMDTEKGSIRVPSTAGAWDVSVLWPKNSNGFGTPVLINKAESWWIEDKAATGMTVSFFGKNLAHGNTDGTNNSYIYIQPIAGGTVTSCTVTDVTPYRVQFTFPSVSIGDYKVWCHNGHGGNYGWSEPLTLTAVDIQDHVRTRVWGSTYNPSVVANDTSVNNATAINNSSYDAAVAGGGVVFIPAGTYTLKSELQPRSFVKWVGAVDGNGNPTTILKLGTDYVPGPFGVWGYHSNAPWSMFENIIFDNSNNVSLGSENTMFLLSSQTMFWMKNCTIKSPSSHPIVIKYPTTKPSSIYFDKVKFTGIEINLSGPRQVFIDSCEFRMRNDCESAIQTNAISNWTITRTTFRDDDLTSDLGWGKGRALAHQNDFGMSECEYVAGNTMDNLGVRKSGANLPDDNSGEQFMYEGNYAKFTGTVTASTSNTVTFSTVPDSSALNCLLTIAKGKGMGQTRKVIAHNGSGIITVDRNFNVLPDSTSLVILAYHTRRVVLYKNYANSSAKPYIVSGTVNASTGVNFYGGCYESIYDSNTAIATRGGASVYGFQSQGNTVDSCSFIELKNNILQGNRNGIVIFANIFFSQWTPPATTILSMLNRNNTITGAVENNVSYNLPNPAFSTPSIDNIVFEHNSPVNTGTKPTGTVANEVLYANTH